MIASQVINHHYYQEPILSQFSFSTPSHLNEALHELPQSKLSVISFVQWLYSVNDMDDKVGLTL